MQDCRSATELADSSILKDVLVLRRALAFLPEGSFGGRGNGTNTTEAMTEFLCGDIKPRGNVFNSLGDSVGHFNISGEHVMCLSCACHVLVMCLSYACHVFVICLSCVCHVLVMCLSCACHVLVKYIYL